MDRSKATIRNPGHVLAPKIGDDTMHDEVRITLSLRLRRSWPKRNKSVLGVSDILLTTPCPVWEGPEKEGHV